MIVIQIEISPETIVNLLTSAIEGGDPVTTARKGGWCNGIYWKSFETDPPPGLWYNDPQNFLKDFILEVHEIEDETTGTIRKHKLTPMNITTGLIAMARSHPRSFGNILSDNIDAPIADIFLQLTLFGKEKYA